MTGQRICKESLLGIFIDAAEGLLIRLLWWIIFEGTQICSSVS